MSYPTRTAAALLATMACSLPACATEIRSVSPAKLSFAPEPGLAPLWLSVVVANRNEIFKLYLDGKAVEMSDTSNGYEADGGALVELAVAQGIVPITASAALVTLYVPAGTHDIGLSYWDDTVVEAKQVEVAQDRFTYVIMYGGDPTSLETVVLSDRPADEPEGSRRIRVVNVQPSQQSLSFDLLDAAGDPIPELSAKLDYGDTYSRSVPYEVTALLEHQGDGGALRFGCSPTELLLYNGFTPGPFGPVPDPYDGPARFGGCEIPDCSCPTR